MVARSVSSQEDFASRRREDTNPRQDVLNRETQLARVIYRDKEYSTVVKIHARACVITLELFLHTHHIYFFYI